MSIFELDAQSLTGDEGLDDAHRVIAEASQDLTKSIQNQDRFGEVYKLFQNLTKVLLDHFEMEEELLSKHRDHADVAVHIQKHHDNHTFFRDALNYANSKFEERISTGRIPNVAELLPVEYFEELVDLDHEMVRLMKKYG